MPDINIIHNVSVNSSTSSKDIPSLLVSQLHSPVRWVETCNFVSKLNLPIIECGPGKVLSGLVKRIDRNVKIIQVNNIDDLENLKQL